MEAANNIVPALQKVMFHAADKQLIATLKSQADSVCRGLIPTEYIRNAFNNFKNGFAYYSQESTEPIGFCIWRIKQTDPITKNRSNPYTYLYIHLICAKKTDYTLSKVMLHDLENVCMEKGIHYIQLQPANKKLQEHYESFGYALTNFLDNVMSKHITQHHIPNPKTTDSIEQVLYTA
jgi:hypothetical protein